MVTLTDASKEGQLLASIEVAGLLRVEEDTLTSWRHDQKGPRYYRMGRQVRYKLEDVLTWQKQALVPVDPEEL